MTSTHQLPNVIDEMVWGEQIGKRRWTSFPSEHFYLLAEGSAHMLSGFLLMSKRVCMICIFIAGTLV